MRVNLGLFQHDINVIWDLAPHDLSIMDHVIQKEPEAIVATGEKHLNNLVDIAFLTIYFPGNVVAHINVNWLSPVKVRTTLIGGEKKMVVWNDLEADEKIKIYGQGSLVKNGEGMYNLLVSYRSGDMWAPKVEQTEAPEGGSQPLHGLHRRQPRSSQRWTRRTARCPPSGSSREISPRTWQPGANRIAFCRGCLRRAKTKNMSTQQVPSRDKYLSIARA
jgi:hypothetical protein